MLMKSTNAWNGFDIAVARFLLLGVFILGAGCTSPIPYRNDPTISSLRDRMTRAEAVEAVKRALTESNQGNWTDSLYKAADLRVSEDGFSSTVTVKVIDSMSRTMIAYHYDYTTHSFPFSQIYAVNLYDANRWGTRYNIVNITEAFRRELPEPYIITMKVHEAPNVPSQFGLRYGFPFYCSAEHKDRFLAALLVLCPRLSFERGPETAGSP